MLCVLAFLAMAVVPAGDAAQAELPFHVIVHRSNPVTSIHRADLSAIFTKRTRSWRDGTEVLPVDQRTKSRIRERFSHAIHGKSVAYVTRYWQRLIFAGRGIPPAEAENDAAVIEAVRAHRGAIGYIARDTPIAADVKILPVTR